MTQEMTNPFFGNQSECSKVKAKIVFEYFKYWASVLGTERMKYEDHRIAYIDLFCGPGKFQDGAESTALLISKAVINNPDWAKQTLLIFNDQNSNHIERLKSSIDEMGGAKLNFQPQYFSFKMDSTTTNDLFKKGLIPSLVFIDPFGVQGLTRDLFGNLMPSWGTDVFSFFNLAYTKRAMPNPKQIGSMKNLFGDTAYNKLVDQLPHVKNHQRSDLIVETYINMLKELGYRYVFAFRMEKSGQPRYLVFSTKNYKGVNSIKAKMFCYSTAVSFIPTRLYNFVETHSSTIPGLFKIRDEEFISHIINHYKGLTLDKKQLVMKEAMISPFTEKDYTRILKKMLAENLLRLVPSEKVRRENTFPEWLKFTIL